MRINGLKLGQGIGLIFEKLRHQLRYLQSSLIPRLMSEWTGEPGEAAEFGRWCRSAQSAGLRRACSGVGQRWANRHRWLQKPFYWKRFLLFQGDYLVFKNRLEPVKTGEVSCGVWGSWAARAHAWPWHRTVLVTSVPWPRRGAGTPGTLAGTVPRGCREGEPHELASRCQQPRGRLARWGAGLSRAAVLCGIGPPSSRACGLGPPARSICWSAATAGHICR